jgi:hypothetical protein
MCIAVRGLAMPLRKRFVSRRRLILLAGAAAIIGGWLILTRAVPSLSTGKMAIAVLIADIVLAPPLLVFVLRRKNRQRAAKPSETG